MKLSEAIVLGSTVSKPRPGSFGNHETGCALGMAWVAIGGGWGEPVPVKEISRTGGDAVVQQWPMLADLERRPCTCWLMRRKMQVRDIIAHLFDRHVFGKADWTLEQLQQWVESVEPKTIDLTDTRTISWPWITTSEQSESVRIQQEVASGLRQASLQEPQL